MLHEFWFMTSLVKFVTHVLCLTRPGICLVVCMSGSWLGNIELLVLDTNLNNSICLFLLSSECCSFGQWNHLWPGLWLWLLWFQNPWEVLPPEDSREGCRKASAHVDESFCWNSQGWHWFCYQNISFNVSALVHSCFTHSFQCRNTKAPSMFHTHMN